MGDAPRTVNTPAKVVDDGLSALISAALPVAKSMEVAAFSWLALPVVSQLFDLVQEWIVDNIRRAISLQTTFLIIDFQTAEEQKAFQEAATAIRGQLSTPEANDAFDKALDRLIHYDGAYSPK